MCPACPFLDGKVLLVALHELILHEDAVEWKELVEMPGKPGLCSGFSNSTSHQLDWIKMCRRLVITPLSVCDGLSRYD